jgi:hypothetical protein
MVHRRSMMMTTNESTTPLILAALLYHLRSRGWDYVDKEKLSGIYDTFQSRTGTLLYGTAFNCSRSTIDQELHNDLALLEECQHVQTTVSRVHLTPSSLAIVAEFEIHPYLKRLIETADEFFALKAAT